MSPSAPWSRRVLALAAVVAVLVLGGCDKTTKAAGTSSSSTTTTVVVTTTAEHRAAVLAAGQSDFDHPSPSLTPGAVFADATVDKICVSGYSASVRDVSESLRDQVYAEYGLAGVDRSQYEIDHLIALELGGSNDLKNLWPEPKSGSDGATSKDSVENRLHELVCSGQLSLNTAQAAIVHWDTLDPSALTTPTTTATTTPPTTATLPPVTAAPLVAPPPANGPTARCNDGTYSYAAHHQGACSHHGGVAVFYT